MSWKDIKGDSEPVESPVQGEAMTAQEVQDMYLGISDDMMSDFQRKLKREAKRTDDVLDSGYFAVVCFNNRKQLEEWCAALGLDSTKLYFDGKDVMKAMRRELKSPDLEFPRTKGIDKDFAARAME